MIIIEIKNKTGSVNDACFVINIVPEVIELLNNFDGLVYILTKEQRLYRSI